MSARECGGQRERGEREVKLRRPRPVLGAWCGARAQTGWIFSISREQKMRTPLFNWVNIKMTNRFACSGEFRVLLLGLRLFPRVWWRSVTPGARHHHHIHEHYGNFSPGYFPPPALISGDHRLMMDEVGHAVMENTIRLTMSHVQHKTQKYEKEKINVKRLYNIIYLPFCWITWICVITILSSLYTKLKDKHNIFLEYHQESFLGWGLICDDVAARWCPQNWFIVVTKFRNCLVFERWDARSERGNDADCAHWAQVTRAELGSEFITR